MAVKYRLFKQKSTNKHFNRMDTTDGEWGTDEATAIRGVSQEYSVDISDIELIEDTSDSRSGTIIQPSMPWSDREREIRNDLLAACDWTQSADTALSESKKAEWATYRQALRDLPSAQSNFHAVTWPTEPS